MAKLSNILLEKEILLESGTNELEVLVFRLGEYTFGINVAKVREVLPLPPVNHLPRAHASVLGVFRLRDKVVPCVSLRKHLNVGPQASDVTPTVILADFNMQQTAFVVDAVERIHRLSWERIMGMPSMMALKDIPVTAVAKVDNRLVIMLDFELIAMQVTDTSVTAVAVDNPLGIDRRSKRILVADDSPTVRMAIASTLKASHYENLRIFENGRDAWEYLNAEAAENADALPVDFVISDVEMPLADGFFLTRKIKEHPRLKEIPVLLYSSIVTPDNHKKGVAVGADAQLSKPDMDRVVHVVDEMLNTFATKCEKDATRAPASVAAPTPVEPPPQQILAKPPTSKPMAPKPVTPKPVDLAPVKSSQSADSELAVDNWDSPLMNTLRVELAERVRTMNRLVAQMDEGRNRSQAAGDILRALHTVKSASSVVPLQDVVDVTHEVESLLASLRETPDVWPMAKLRLYLEWLGDVSEPHLELEKSLARGYDLLSALRR